MLIYTSEQGTSFTSVLRGETDQHREYTYSMQSTRGEPWGGGWKPRAISTTKPRWLRWSAS